MPSDQTQHQSPEDLQKARELSLEGAQPPGQIQGYQLQNYIGSGAFGEVWAATQLKTGRRVAVKFYTRRTQADIKMLAQEVEKLVALTADARYVVQLLDVGFDASPPYYIMDYIERGSLEDLMKNGTELPTAQALDLFQDIATGMMLLHGKGILHCDLKPGNVLLDQDGKPRVADFGQSRLSTEETPALGTLFYMAPEQADLNAIPDARWDVYGLGAMFYCMLTGKPPYYSSELAREIEATEKIGERLKSYRKALIKSPAPTGHRQIAGVDRMLADLIDKCIAADPKKRFNSVQSLLLALRQREMSRARRPLMLLGLIGPLMLMAVVSLFGWWAFTQAAERTNNAVMAKAEDSNEFAAELAAQSAGEQLDEYYRAVRQLARDESFLEMFQEFIEDEEIARQRVLLADPTKNAEDGEEIDPATGDVRRLFKQNPLRRKLQAPLKSRMENVDHEFPFAASWFVCDRFGNQVASVFQDLDNRTLGNNYARRSYFTGNDEDLTDASLALTNVNQKLTVLNSRKIIGIGANGEIDRRTVLSAVFPSEQSKTWKVAFSSPIVLENKVMGIVAVTVDLGSLIELAANVIAARSNDEESPNLQAQYVMLVDGRNPKNPGVILEHPLFNKVIQNDEKLSDELANMTVDLDAALDDEVFNDPVGKTKYGERFHFGRDSIVSIVDVAVEKLDSRQPSGDPNKLDIARSPAPREATGLFVLAVQDYEHILADVQKLESDLGRLAVLALLMLICVTLGMWVFVNRMMRESRERLARAFSPSSDSSNSMGQDALQTKRFSTDSSFPTPVPPKEVPRTDGSATNTSGTDDSGR